MPCSFSSYRQLLTTLWEQQFVRDGLLQDKIFRLFFLLGKCNIQPYHIKMALFINMMFSLYTYLIMNTHVSKILLTCRQNNNQHFVAKSHWWRGVLDTTLCDKVCQWLMAGLWFSPGSPVSSTNKTDSHDIQLTLIVLNSVDSNFRLSRIFIEVPNFVVYKYI
jgi:hypothetical protein